MDRIMNQMDDERQQAWAELLTVAPAGWFAGQPSYHNERREFVLYALDPSEKLVVGLRNASGRPSRRLRWAGGRWPAACGRSRRSGAEVEMLVRQAATHR